MNDDSQTNQAPYQSTYQLKNLNLDGTVPDTRLSNADDCQQLVLNWVFADRPRSAARALTKGLIDGMPPYSQAALRAAGRSNAANFNTRKAEYFKNTAVNSYYDTFSEAQYPITVYTGFGNPDERARLSQIITEELAVICQESDVFRYNECMCHDQMVTFGAGPMMFRDDTDWRAFSVGYGDLYVPEMTKSTTTEWDACAVRKTFNVAELYEFIKNPKEAREIGWDVEATRNAIIWAAPRNQNGVNLITWEYIEQRLKNNSMWWASQSRTVTINHVFCREFPTGDDVRGRITHAIVQEGPGAATGLHPVEGQKTATRFLFHRIGRFKDWTEVIHPIYYDHGGGGDHHSVTGLAMKMYSILNYENRLTCATLDKAFAPKLLFQPTTADASETLSIAHFGEYGKVPAGVNLLQNPMQGMINDVMAANEMLDQIIQGNLSTYRVNLDDEQTGNPDTATAVRFKAQAQAQVGKTQLDRFFDQKDGQYREQVRRICDPVYARSSLPGSDDARKFQMRCFARGVPPQALLMIMRVFATRITGQGSPVARQQAFVTFMPLLGRLPEDGQKQFVDDYAAALFGRAVAPRYTGDDQIPGASTEQQERAWDQVATAMAGFTPPWSPSQNPVVFAQTFLQAAVQSLQSVQQGGDPGKVLQFLDVIGPAIAQQIQRMAGDPTRKDAMRMLEAQFKQMAAAKDNLQSTYQQLQQRKAAMRQQQAQLQAAQNGADPRIQIAAARAQSEIGIKQRAAAARVGIEQQKANAQVEISARKHAVETGIKTASAASDIALDRQMAAHEMDQNGPLHEADVEGTSAQ